MTQYCHPVTDGSPEAQREAEMGEVTPHLRALLCRPLLRPDSFINLAPPTDPDGDSIPSAQSGPSRGSLIKKNSSVHKSLLLLSLPWAAGHAFWRERKGSR